MTDEANYISAEDYCTFYRIDIDFIYQLKEQGLLQTDEIEGKQYLHADDLASAEKFMHLHYDLDINVAGIEAIYHLLNRVGTLQQTVLQLQNRLADYQQVKAEL